MSEICITIIWMFVFFFVLLQREQCFLLIHGNTYRCLADYSGSGGSAMGSRQIDRRLGVDSV